MPILIDEKRKYQRLRPTIKEQAILANSGYTWLLSSNVSAVATSGTDLYIRFHNGSLYRYKGKANLKENLIAATSKGKWVWRFLRRRNVPYQKVGSMPLDSDLDVTDEELFAQQVGIDIKDVDLDNVQQLDKFNGETIGLINTTVTKDILVSAVAMNALISNMVNLNNLQMNQQFPISTIVENITL